MPITGASLYRFRTRRKRRDLRFSRMSRLGVQPARRMMPDISSALKARIVLERMFPAAPTCSGAATPASSSGNSTMQTTSYSPTVHSNSRTLPPALSTSLERS